MSARMTDAEARAAVARIRVLHFQYLPAMVDFYCCAHCNVISSIGGGLGYVAWPCDTIRALDGEEG